MSSILSEPASAGQMWLIEDECPSTNKEYMNISRPNKKQGKLNFVDPLLQLLQELQAAAEGSALKGLD